MRAGRCCLPGVEIAAAANVIRGARMATVAKCRYDVELNGGVYGNEGRVVSGNTW